MPAFKQLEIKLSHGIASLPFIDFHMSLIIAKETMGSKSDHSREMTWKGLGDLDCFCTQSHPRYHQIVTQDCHLPPLMLVISL